MSEESPLTPSTNEYHDEQAQESLLSAAVNENRDEQIRYNPTSAGWANDVMLWRRKDRSVMVLVAATVTWVLMEICSFNFITLASWFAMAAITCLFALGHINRLLKRGDQIPDLSKMEISEQSARETATAFKWRIENAVHLMFHISCEREWFVCWGAVASLYLLSIVGSHLDLLTQTYIGVIGVMILPFTYVKNEVKINGYLDTAKTKCRSYYNFVVEKIERVRENLTRKGKGVVKEKKVE